MKIKQLVWEDCIPTISSSVVKAANMLEYYFIIYHPYSGDGFDVDEFCVDVNDITATGDDGVPLVFPAAEVAQRWCQDYLEARIKEAVELKAAEIRWNDRGADEVFRYESDCGNYLIEKCEGGGFRAYYEFSDYRREDSWFRDTLEEAQKVCQDHKQKQMERYL